MKTNTDITVYNRTTIDRENVYVRATVVGVFWEDSEAINRLQSGLENADKATVFVSFGAGFSKEMVEPKEFVKDPENTMTFAPGDLVVKGIVEDEITSEKDLKIKYDYVRQIVSADKNDFGSKKMQHYELGLR